jgi:hypothetical protein
MLCQALLNVLLNVIMLSVIMLCALMVNVIIQNVVMLSVYNRIKQQLKAFTNWA